MMCAGATASQRLARQTFVERINAFYAACLTEMSNGGALRKRRAKVQSWMDATSPGSSLRCSH